MGKIGGKGITARASSFRIFFVYNGKRYWETLALAPTPANWKYAEALRKRLMHAIEMGTFNFAEFFPDSKNVNKTGKPSFIDIADQWLDSRKRRLTTTSVMCYRSIIDCHFFPAFGKREMCDISFLDLNNFMSGLEVSNKTFNNILSVLHSIYKFAIKASAVTGVTIDHVAGIERTKVGKSNPDPLTPSEVKMVLADMAKHYPEPIEIYFGLAFRIGFRPSEGIALKWGDIDWNKKLLKISRARVRGREKGLKTEGTAKADEGEGRFVELDDYCIALLQRLKKHSFMKSEYLFLTTRTGLPLKGTECMVQTYWRPSLKRCKIRDRDARQTRHTCATLMLMANAPRRWAAERLGHSEEMFSQVYSKWMPDIDGRQSLAKLTAMFEHEEIKLKTAGEHHD